MVVKSLLPRILSGSNEHNAFAITVILARDILRSIIYILYFYIWRVKSDFLLRVYKLLSLLKCIIRTTVTDLQGISVEFRAFRF